VNYTPKRVNACKQGYIHPATFRSIAAPRTMAGAGPQNAQVRKYARYCLHFNLIEIGFYIYFKKHDY